MKLQITLICGKTTHKKSPRRKNPGGYIIDAPFDHVTPYLTLTSLLRPTATNPSTPSITLEFIHAGGAGTACETGATLGDATAPSASAALKFSFPLSSPIVSAFASTTIEYVPAPRTPCTLNPSRLSVAIGVNTFAPSPLVRLICPIADPSPLRFAVNVYPSASETLNVTSNTDVLDPLSEIPVPNIELLCTNPLSANPVPPSAEFCSADAEEFALSAPKLADADAFPRKSPNPPACCD